MSKLNKEEVLKKLVEFQNRAKGLNEIRRSLMDEVTEIIGEPGNIDYTNRFIVENIAGYLGENIFLDGSESAGYYFWTESNC